MILVKYIFKDICKNQLIILLSLLLVCFCQKFIKLFNVDDYFSIYLFFLYLILNIPETGKLVIPFSLFLSIFVTYYKFHEHNEILAMYSCGISKYTIMKSVYLYSFIVFIIYIINIVYMFPYCKQYQDHIFFEVKKNECFSKLIEKKFQFLSTKKLVLFVTNIDNKILKNVFLIKKEYNLCDNYVYKIIIAERGEIYCNSDYLHSIFLRYGTYYEIHKDKFMYNNVCISNFLQYHTLFDCDLGCLYPLHIPIDYMSISQLLYSSIPEKYIELNWRLIISISIFIMSILAASLMMYISYNYVFNFLLGMILYVLFFELHILLRSCVESNQIIFIVYMWVVNIFYFMIILLVNTWDFFRLKKFNNFVSLLKHN